MRGEAALEQRQRLEIARARLEDAFVAERILGQLGMTSSGFFVEPARQAHVHVRAATASGEA